jgi:hypothetical protein
MSVPFVEQKTATTYVNPFKKDAQHIKALAKFKDNAVDPLVGQTKIYFLETLEKTAFYKDAANMGKIKSFDSLSKVGKIPIKVGDTFRLVKERNDETLTNASLHRDYVSSALAVKEDGTVFRDYDFHRHLEEKGYERELNDNGRPSEFFFFDSLEQVEQEFAEFTAKRFTKQIVLRTVQHYGLDLLANATAAGALLINFGSCMRSGKTIMSLVHAKRNNCMPVYIGKNLTSQSSADDDNNEYGIVPHMVTASLHGQDEDTDNELSKKAWKVIVKIDAANKDNQKIIIYVDECDDASHTEKSRAIIEQVTKHYYDKGMLFQVITMTGTRKERGRKILQDLSFMPGKVKELSIEYWEMQILQQEDTVKRNFVSINFFQGNAQGLVNIADALKDRTTGHASLASFIKLLLSPNNFGLKDTRKYPHWFMKFCTTAKSPITDLAKYLNINLSTVAGKEYLYIPINGDTTSSRKAQKFCKKVIEDNPTKIVVFLSFGMATTSFSVVPIGNSAVFSDNPITADDTQAYHRSATWETGKEWCNMVQITTAEPNTVSWNDVFESELPPGPKQGKLPISKEILHLNSLIHVECDQTTKEMTITSEFAEYVLDKRAVAQTRVANVMHMLKEHDDIKDIILECVDPKTGKIKKALKSGTEKGDTFDPFGLLKNRKKKKTKQTGLTVAKQEAILRAFADNAVNVPAVAREQEIALAEFDLWDEVNVDQELFNLVCEQSEDFKETINTIYRLCDDDSHLQTYLDKFMI